MKKNLLIFSFLMVSILSLPAVATNSDVAKERRWAEQVVDGLLDGDEVWLNDADGHEFLGIITTSDSKREPALVLVHGIGVHPNWPDVIYPLREGLLEQGFTTLSIQMPILANDADARDYVPLLAEVPGRFEAALGYLDNEGHRDVAIVGHSLGATMAVYYMAQGGSTAVKSLVGVGMGPGITGTENIEALAKTRVPVFDLYGSEDLEQVLHSVDRRKEAGNRGVGRVYRQVSVNGANHFFQGHEDALLQQVIEWLEAQH